MIRRLSSGPSAMLKTTMMTVLLLGAAAVGAQTPENPASEHASPPAGTSSNTGDSNRDTNSKDADTSQVGFHDLICKPNGSEDSFDCADEATPAKIVPIPSQVLWPRRQDEPISG
jgi:hypothetical protein